ncbi:hypothetical protein [Neorhizobium galegae]|uniref:hypothetical protein n=1 Tax=Neorhizobium galegae TaxID=399 RepID=UPI0006210989|nr:hypothetical protein [Neorhizobium galegae]CDZ62197.1 Hypothetical protein NGAL_HAMBI2566_49460 [Neorhizobium galegae bv. orientalis]KAB1127158.1 hypothetical protein F4V90_08810 [Neorhizobium galegae]MCQ1573541.1 hypothetical protein [Neorhizobium galegae]MCQ1808864.1 hypothetical protein [Neorhizobium galegae]CDZ68846.1 Hypothetical protein NGAL_HAMBI2610_04390 [Neorhizobium galegae bv. orientalis]
MPSYHEVRLYLGGLWLLIRGDARGLRPFDISDEGVLRSFWAVAWCAPALIVGWIFRRMEYLHHFPQREDYSFIFFLKMLVLEAAQWIVPTVALIALGFILRFMPLVRILIVVRNWFTVPLAYATYVILTPLAFLSDQLGALASYGVIALAATLLIAALLLMWCILRTVMGGPVMIRVATLGLVVVAEVIVARELENIMGVSLT